MILNKREKVALFVLLGTGVAGWGIRLLQGVGGEPFSPLRVAADSAAREPAGTAPHIRFQITKSHNRRIDLNRAGVGGLQQIKGIGPKLAQRIVAYRDKSGPFAEVTNLLEVPGIGPKTLEKIKSHISITDSTTESDLPGVEPRQPNSGR